MPRDVVADRAGIDQDASSNADPYELTGIEFAEDRPARHASKQALRLFDRRKRLERRRPAAVRCLVVTDHVHIVREVSSLRETGDHELSDSDLERRFPILFSQCAESIRRLREFDLDQWKHDDGGRWRSEGKVDHAHLDEHARRLLRSVQLELAARRTRPLTRDEASELAPSRKVALEALIRVGRKTGNGNRYAKQVQSELAIAGEPLYVCVGSNYQRRIEGLPFRTHGCFAVFPDPPFGRGNMWPTLCPPCRPKNGERNPARDQAGALARRIKEYRALRDAQE